MKGESNHFNNYNKPAKNKINLLFYPVVDNAFMLLYLTCVSIYLLLLIRVYNVWLHTYVYNV